MTVFRYAPCAMPFVITLYLVPYTLHLYLLALRYAFCDRLMPYTLDLVPCAYGFAHRLTESSISARIQLRFHMNTLLPLPDPKGKHFSFSNPQSEFRNH